jgi:hypothetical protein
MRLFEHPDFEQAILRAAEYFREQQLRPAIIEKDYYVTEALRIIADTVSDKIIFKGGTSLSKGWNLIQRFSEDIDIFLDPAAFHPALERAGLIGNSKSFATPSARTRRSRLLRTRARPSAASGGMTDFPICSFSAAPVKWPTEFCLKQAQLAVASPRRRLNSVLTSASFSGTRGYRWARQTKECSRCDCCIFGGPSWRRCSLSTAG